jgi:hypothetical protein
MTETYWGVPVPIMAAALPLAGAAAYWLVARAARWARGNAAWRRDELRQLRKALDRLRRRENAYATGFEILCLVMPQQLTIAQRQAIQRSRELFETALLHTDSAGGE